MRWFATALLVLAGLPSLAPAACAETGVMDEVVIFYFPFDEDTYVPITRESIEGKAICKLTLPRSSNQALVLQKAIEAAKAGRFDNRAVRLKVVGLVQAIVYVDVDGGLLHEHTAKEGRMAEDSFSGVKSLLAGLAQQRGCE